MENDSQKILSVIIPVYNCAPVIVRCMDSIDYPDCEIIVVNDGSTDNGVEVVEQYASTHPQVRLFNKPNGGVSSARNLGIKEATGKYVIFVDADDYLMANGLKRIIELAEEQNADVVLYAANYVTEQNLIPIRSVKDDEMQINTFVSGKEALKRYDIPDYYIWDAVYSRELLVNNHIICKEDLCLHEDDVFKGEVYSVAEKVVVTDLRLYCYVVSSNYSSTHKQSIERQRALIASGWKAIEYRKAYIKERCPDVMSLDKLKYMRWVCHPKMAMKARYTLKEYKLLLEKFHQLDVYPLDYRWINVSHWYASPLKKFKYAVKTFLTNHPWIIYQFNNYGKRGI